MTGPQNRRAPPAACACGKPLTVRFGPGRKKSICEACEEERRRKWSRDAQAQQREKLRAMLTQKCARCGVCIKVDSRRRYCAPCSYDVRKAASLSRSKKVKAAKAVKAATPRLIRARGFYENG